MDPPPERNRHGGEAGRGGGVSGSPVILNASDSSTHGLTDPLTTRIRSDNYPLPNPYGYNSYSWVLTLIVSVWM